MRGPRGPLTGRGRGVFDLCRAATGLASVQVIEIGVLTEAGKVIAARLVLDSGADLIKTCTGSGPGCATVRNIPLIRGMVGADIGIKASGGVAPSKMRSP